MRSISAEEAIKKLKAGNEAYLESKTGTGDISPQRRADTCQNGQHPYAIIIGCSDSRAIPESIFSAGIGDLFVIRVAGNVIDEHQLGSIEYATGHLGCRLIVVLGHDHCGAVGAALHDDPHGHVKTITDQIKRAIGDEKDEQKASCLNVRQSVAMIKESIDLGDDMKVIGAMYHIEDGRVDFDI